MGIDHPDQLAEISAELRRLGRETRDGAAEPFDIAVELGSDPAPYAAAGATWGLVAFPWNPVSVDQVRGVIREGPAASRLGLLTVYSSCIHAEATRVQLLTQRRPDPLTRFRAAELAGFRRSG